MTRPSWKRVFTAARLLWSEYLQSRWLLAVTAAGLFVVLPSAIVPGGIPASRVGEAVIPFGTLLVFALLSGAWDREFSTRRGTILLATGLRPVEFVLSVQAATVLVFLLELILVGTGVALARSMPSGWSLDAFLAALVLPVALLPLLTFGLALGIVIPRWWNTVAIVGGFFTLVLASYLFSQLGWNVRVVEAVFDFFSGRPLVTAVLRHGVSSPGTVLLVLRDMAKALLFVIVAAAGARHLEARSFA